MDKADKHRWSTWTHQEAANLLFHEDDYVVDLDTDAVVNIFPDDEEDDEDDNNEDDDQSEGNNGRTIVTKPLSALTLKKIQKLQEVFDQGVKESAKYTSEEEEAQKNCSHALAVETVKELDSFCEERGMDYQLQRQKFHELYQNLKRANNRELRLKIISQEILPAQLVAMDAKELAPEALKRKRETEAEKYFKQQVIIREDPNAPILRKTHKGIEVIGLIEANQGISSRTNTPIALSPVDDDPQVIKSNPLAHIPWTNEMANLLGQDQPISPSSNVNVEPPKKVRRTKEHQPEQEVASTSPASFVSLLFHPWNALVKYRKDLADKLKLTSIPNDPTTISIFNQSQRMNDRLAWLNERYTARNVDAAIAEHIQRLQTALDTHVTNLHSTLPVQEPPSHLALPPAAEETEKIIF